jgi:hypothetical protein
MLIFLAVQPPPPRSWLRLASPNTTQPTAIFTIMNYNILCDKYATRHVYGYCPSWALKWDYRRKQILEELRSYSADIIALQVRYINILFISGVTRILTVVGLGCSVRSLVMGFNCSDFDGW